MADIQFLALGDPDHLDPRSAQYLRSSQLLRVLTRQLFAYPVSGDMPDPKGAFIPVPDVAAVMPTRENGGISSDGRTYTIALRDDGYWDSHPPRAITAADFLRAFTGIAHPEHADSRAYFTDTIVGMQEFCAAYDDAFGAGAPDAASLAAFKRSHRIAGLRAPDDTTLVVTLKQPANDFLNILASGCLAAVPIEHDEYPPGSDALAEHFVSAGPYRVARYAREAQELRLEPNAVWNPASDRIRRQVPGAIKTGHRSAATDGVLDAWRYGTVTWAIDNPDPCEFPQVYPAFSLNPYLVLNLRSPNAGGAVRNLMVRQAIAFAIDRDPIQQLFARLKGVACAPQLSVIPPGNVGHSGVDPYPTPAGRGDAARARALLAAAGYGKGLSLIAAVRDNDLHQQVMQAVAGSLERAGVTLVVRRYSPAEYYGSLLTDPREAEAGVWDIAEPGWTPDWFGNNGRAFLRPLFATNGIGNYGGYSSEAADRLIDDALEELDEAELPGRWRQVEAQIMRDLPVVPLLAFACTSCIGRIGAAGWGTRSPAPFRFT